MAQSTLRLSADSPADVAQAARILCAGGTVAFATETVYGLGANALNPAAIARIFAAKQRPAWDPLIVHIADATGLPTVAAGLPEPARVWAERFWPGPLTLLLPRAAAIPDSVTAGRLRVGVRIPRHPAAQALLRAAAIPVAAPSANLFGHVSPTTAAHVLVDLNGRIDAVLDGGPCEHGLESTVVDACEDPCVLYRPGAVTLEQLAEVWPRVVPYGPEEAREEAEPASLPSPGVGLRHYAPRARLLLVEHGPVQPARTLEMLVNPADGKTGLLLPENFFSPGQLASLPREIEVYRWGRWTHPQELGARLFAGLRALDGAGTARIVCPLPASEGLGFALRDRLGKAARPR